ncbi:MAG: polymerase sigma factor SigL [Acidobacteria bacterium]|jgi:RNA polymerase sigma-70 factor (ECF subfamily)|nr:polymerase sigma factor SigL [Acidobacteriota bacterium]
MADDTPAPPAREHISRLLQAWTRQDPAARDALVPIVYDELHRLAHHYMRTERAGHTLQTTALVNEAYLRLADVDRLEWNDRAHFFAMAATMMRRILVDHARAHARDKRGGGVVMTSLDADLAAPVGEVDVLALDQALERLAQIDPRQARLVELRYFAGLTIDEAAEALHISSGTLKREWVIAKAWLYRELQGR